MKKTEAPIRPLAVEINGELHPIEKRIIEKYRLEPGMKTAAGYPIVEAVT
jgi:hypothetical protein